MFQPGGPYNKMKMQNSHIRGIPVESPLPSGSHLGLVSALHEHIHTYLQWKCTEKKQFTTPTSPTRIPEMEAQLGFPEENYTTQVAVNGWRTHLVRCLKYDLP